MKMRVRGNSIRFRLTQSEVAEFSEKGLVIEAIEFGGENRLIYALESRADAETVKAEFEDNRIVITVPQTQAKHWAKSGEVGIEEKQDINGTKFLQLLIEKDFACLEPLEGEDDADNFPHPSGNLKC